MLSQSRGTLGFASGILARSGGAGPATLSPGEKRGTLRPLHLCTLPKWIRVRNLR